MSRPATLSIYFKHSWQKKFNFGLNLFGKNQKTPENLYIFGTFQTKMDEI